MQNDKLFLYDMRRAAQKIKEFTQGMTKEEFLASELHTNAVIRQIQIIGEAARLVSEALKAAHPEIQWRNISNMRNTLIHRYFNVDLNIVWDVVDIYADELIVQIDPLLPPEDEPPATPSPAE